MDSHAIECESRDLVVTLKQVENQKVYGDLFLIRQAIDNLFRNAIDFSPAGGKIWVDIHPQNNSAAIDIIDEGPGIADYVRRTGL